MINKPLDIGTIVKHFNDYYIITAIHAPPITGKNGFKYYGYSVKLLNGQPIANTLYSQALEPLQPIEYMKLKKKGLI